MVLLLGLQAAVLALALSAAAAPASLTGPDPLAEFAASMAPSAPARARLLERAPKARLRVDVLDQTAKPYGVQLSLKTRRAVRAGDALKARFRIRRPWLIGRPVRAEFVFERAGGDYLKSVNYPVIAGRNWTLVELPFRAAADHAAGKAQANIRLGYGPQRVEIDGFELLHLGESARAAAPAVPKIDYAGRSPDALWRRAAALRIERLRKGPLTVTVMDAHGRPVPGARVRARLTRHAFGFGAAVNARYLHESRGTRANGAYRRILASHFNQAVLDNALKWPYWQSQRAMSDAALAWLASAGLPARGHTLVWPGWTRLPAEVAALRRRPQALEAAILAHIAQKGTAYRGRIFEWDAVNEPFGEPGVLDALPLGRHVAGWLEAARRADPEARLLVNEAGIIDGGGLDRMRQALFEALVRDLTREKAPLGAVGLQAHMGPWLTPPNELLALLDRFGGLGLPLVITELDVATPDERLRADYLRDFLIAAFSHPAVEGVVLWDFWEGLTESPHSALFSAEGAPTPAGAAFRDLVHRRWVTDVQSEADAHGRLRLRGFLGDYEITAAHAGKSATARAVLRKGGGAAVLKLP